MSTTLESFIKLKDELLAEFKAKEKELANIRKELIGLGILTDDKPEVTTTKPRRKRGPKMSEEQKVEKMKGAADGKPFTIKESQDATGISGLNVLIKKLEKAKTVKKIPGKPPQTPHRYQFIK